MAKRFPVAKYNWLVKRFVLCTLTMEEASKAAKNVISQEMWGVFKPDWRYWDWNCVRCAFLWQLTPEGFYYWEEVSAKLRENKL